MIRCIELRTKVPVFAAGGNSDIFYTDKWKTSSSAKICDDLILLKNGQQNLLTGMRKCV